MIDDVATEELARLGHDHDEPDILLTLNAGGNDLLDALTAGRRLETVVTRIMRRYSDLVDTVREELPHATLVLTTVYDPTDGTGILPALADRGRLPLDQLDRFNDLVRKTAQHDDGLVLADVHQHFMGHGQKAPDRERWYWKRNPIEPSARGASEIRRVWWQALDSIV
jgi:lysophospholipase L1-like esterase